MKTFGAMSFCKYIGVVLFLGLLDDCYGMCPFARMMNQYNFSGEWIMTHKEENMKYLLHVCHPLGNEIFFGISYFDEPNWLVGFGGGNWSQWNMGIGGIKYMLNGANNTIDESGFIVTMDPDGHEWFLRDLKTQYSLDIQSQDYSTHDLCAVPYGYNKRVEKNAKIRNVLKKKRFIPREIEKREKKIRKFEARNENGEKNEKIEKLRNEIKELESKPEEPITDNENPDLVQVPTLFGKTYMTDDSTFKVTFIDNNTFCVFNESQTESDISLRNASSWYGGTAFRSDWYTNDGKFGTHFYLQYDQDKLIASNVIMNEDKQRGYSTVLSLASDDQALQCQASDSIQTKDCQEGSDHCEL